MLPIFIGVVAHKQFNMVKMENYYPIFVGNSSESLHDNFPGISYTDRTNDSIHQLNPFYSELTAQYWMWKNIKEAQYKGMVHYRRFILDSNGSIISDEKIMDILQHTDLIVSKKVFSKNNIYDTYAEHHNIEDLDLIRNIIADKYVEYLQNFDKIMKLHSYHSLNILITNKFLFDEYSEWLFDILFEAQKFVSESSDIYQKRVYGFLSERLLDVWILTKNLSVKELNVSKTDQTISKNIYEHLKYLSYRILFKQ